METFALGRARQANPLRGRGGLACEAVDLALRRAHEEPAVGYGK